MISRLKRVFDQPDPRGHLIASIGAVYGHRRSRAVFKQNLEVIREAHASLKGKRILILGTGPSAAALSKGIVGAYDFVVLLNHAIQYSPILKAFGLPPDALGFFSQDKKRVIEVSPWLSLSEIPRSKCIFMPDFPQSVFFVDLHRIPLTLIGGFVPYQKVHVNPAAFVAVRGWNYVYTPVPVDPVLLERAYKSFMDRTDPSPVTLPYSSAFSAITLYSFFRPATISLIGCDFTGPLFSRYPMEEVFSFLQSMLSNYGIGLTCLSSELLSSDALPSA